jgi:hypothetical protein
MVPCDVQYVLPLEFREFYLKVAKYVTQRYVNPKSGGLAERPVFKLAFLQNTQYNELVDTMEQLVMSSFSSFQIFMLNKLTSQPGSPIDPNAPLTMGEIIGYPFPESVQPYDHLCYGVVL